MSALGQKRTFRNVRAMSAFPPKADIGTQPCDVGFVPEVDIEERDDVAPPRAEGSRIVTSQSLLSRALHQTN
jgi:hypothetical protein